MSIRIMSKVWELYPGGGTELLSLLALADCFQSLAAFRMLA